MLLCLGASIIYLFFFFPTGLNYLSAHFQLKWEEIDDPKLSRVPDYEAGELEAVRGMGARSRQRLESKDAKEAHSYSLHANAILHFLVLIVKEASVEVKEPKDQRWMINALFVSKEGALSSRKPWRIIGILSGLCPPSNRKTDPTDRAGASPVATAVAAFPR